MPSTLVEFAAALRDARQQRNVPREVNTLLAQRAEGRFSSELHLLRLGDAERLPAPSPTNDVEALPALRSILDRANVVARRRRLAESGSRTPSASGSDRNSGGDGHGDTPSEGDGSRDNATSTPRLPAIVPPFRGLARRDSGARTVLEAAIGASTEGLRHLQSLPHQAAAAGLGLAADPFAVSHAGSVPSGPARAPLVPTSPPSARQMVRRAVAANQQIIPSAPVAEAAANGAPEGGGGTVTFSDVVDPFTVVGISRAVEQAPFTVPPIAERPQVAAFLTECAASALENLDLESPSGASGRGSAKRGTGSSHSPLRPKGIASAATTRRATMVRMASHRSQSEDQTAVGSLAWLSSAPDSAHFNSAASAGDFAPLLGGPVPPTTVENPLEFDLNLAREKHVQAYRRGGFVPQYGVAIQAATSGSGTPRGVRSARGHPITNDVTSASLTARRPAPPLGSSKITPRTARSAVLVTPGAHGKDDEDDDNPSTLSRRFLQGLQQRGREFGKYSSGELQRVLHAKAVFADVKVAELNGLIDSPRGRCHPADSVLDVLRRRIHRAAAAKDRRERLQVFFDHIELVREHAAPLARSADEAARNNAFFDAVGAAIATSNGHHTFAELPPLALAHFSREALLRRDVVDLLVLVGPLFGAAAGQVETWAQLELRRFEGRDIAGIFRGTDASIGQAANDASFKLHIYACRGLSTAAFHPRTMLNVRVSAERRVFQTAASPLSKPSWGEAVAVHLGNDATPVMLYLHGAGDIIGQGSLVVAKMPVGRTTRLWVPIPGALLPHAELHVGVEMLAPRGASAPSSPLTVTPPRPRGRAGPEWP